MQNQFSQIFQDLPVGAVFQAKLHDLEKDGGQWRKTAQDEAILLIAPYEYNPSCETHSFYDKISVGTVIQAESNWAVDHDLRESARMAAREARTPTHEFKIHDPRYDAVHVFKTGEEAISKAEEIGCSRFQRVDLDGITQVKKIGEHWVADDNKPVTNTQTQAEIDAARQIEKNEIAAWAAKRDADIKRFQESSQGSKHEHEKVGKDSLASQKKETPAQKMAAFLEKHGDNAKACLSKYPALDGALKTIALMDAACKNLGFDTDKRNAVMSKVKKCAVSLVAQGHRFNPRTYGPEKSAANKEPELVR